MIDLMKACHILPISFSFISLSGEVTVMKLYIKGTLSYSTKKKNKIEHQTSDYFQHCFRFMLHSQVSKQNFYSLFLNLSTLLCCIDLSISPWCMANPKARVLWRIRGDCIKLLYKQGTCDIVGIKKKSFGDSLFKIMLLKASRRFHVFKKETEFC